MKKILNASALFLPAFVFSNLTFANGMNGVDYSVFADGNPQTLNANGHSGRGGRDGRDGDDRYDCASGGDGENGEGGESGGDTGKITIFYDDISHLQALTVYQIPGEGGYGGRGGRGGRGGSCESTDENGRTTYYQASSGTDGSSGWDGPNGIHKGIWLVPNLRNLAPEINVVQDTVSAIGTSKTYALSKYHWNSSSSGAYQLFSRQSRLGKDSYSAYNGRSDTQAEVIWNAPITAEHFKNTSFTLTYDGSKVGIGFGYEVWSKTTQVDSQIQIDQLLRVSEVKGLKLGKFTGNGSAASLSVDDAANITHLLSDNMTIEYRTPNSIGQYVGRYTGPVPAGAITARAYGSGYDIAVGSLKIGSGYLKIGSGYLKKGTKVQIKLYLTRSAFGNTEKVSLNEKYTVQ